jgi:hypothetical protein
MHQPSPDFSLELVPVVLGLEHQPVVRPGESAGVRGILLGPIGVEEPDEGLPPAVVAQQQFTDPESDIVTGLEVDGDRSQNVVSHHQLVVTHDVADVVARPHPPAAASPAAGREAGHDQGRQNQRPFP